MGERLSRGRSICYGCHGTKGCDSILAMTKGVIVSGIEGSKGTRNHEVHIRQRCKEQSVRKCECLDNVPFC